MGRKHRKVLEHQSKKGRYLNEAHTYEAIEECKDVLWHIHRGNPSWGKEWYEAVKCHMYNTALRVVEVRGKGDSFITAIATIQELIDLDKHIKTF